MWIDIVLLAVLVICVITDLKSRKIYNKVLFPALLAALIIHWMMGGWAAIGFSLTGFFCGLGLLLIPYLLGGMGAGDVKLLALIGALKGTYFVLAAAIYMSLIGGLIAIIVILFRKGFAERMKTLVYFIFGLRYGIRIPLAFGKEWKTQTYPYGLAIAGGAVASLLYKGWL